LPFEVCYRLVGDLAENGCRGLVIEGGGEPTIYPRFREVVDSATEKGLAVGLITNGIVFNYSDLLPKMEWVRVSLDADSRETFSEWKGKDAFYDVLGNIRKMCENAGDCVIGVGYVVTMHNIKYLEEITMLLYEYGVNYLYLRPVIDNPDMSISENLFYLKKYETDSFSVMIHAMDENVIAGNDGLPCVSHPLSCVIAGDGSVFLCGRLNIHDWFEPLGNLNDNSFYEIWNGEKRKEQVGMVKDASFCEKWCPECRLTKYNKVFSNISKIKTRNFI
jgi:MoaA/NifB/PqqE/SkfB family radical SAM enzyme